MRAALFEDRVDGGRALSQALGKYRGTDCVVYGLPRGGVVTAKVVAHSLEAPLDVVITRKLGHPFSPEYAIGAVSAEGDVVVNEALLPELPEGYLEQEKARKAEEAKERQERFLAGRSRPKVTGKTAILVDDGIATGYTMKAAILSVKRQGPAKVVVAAPVGPPDVHSQFEGMADEVVVPFTPTDFFAIGTYYEEFSQVDDEEVARILKESALDASGRTA